LGDNWALKSSNLRKLIRNLEEFYHDALEKDADFAAIDITTMAKQATGTATLVELVAAAAVTCPDKGTYVQRIMSMSEDSQNGMKGVLQDALGRLSDYDSQMEEGDENELVFDDQNDMEDEPAGSEGAGGDHLFAGGMALEEDLAEARRDIASLQAQAQVSQEDHVKAEAKLRTVVEDLQDRLVQRQNDLIQLEEELRSSTNELDVAKNHLLETADQKNQLADDLEIATAKAQQLSKAEATVSMLKKRLESAGNMNSQVNTMEDQAAKYLDQIQELEQELKKSSGLQKTVDEVTEELRHVQIDASAKETAQSSAAQEVADWKGKYQAAEAAKKQYMEELSELRSQMEGEKEGESMAQEATLAAQAEQIKQLEEEKTRLVASLEGSSGGAAGAAAVASIEVDALKKQVAALQTSVEAKDKENEKVSSDKDKLETYTKRTLAKFQEKYLVALQECKAKLKEKQDKIEALEKKAANERSAQKREERLLSSVIYELGLAIMQNRLKER
jgi:protein HOOK3